MKKLTLADADLTGTRVLVRVDFNVPLEGGRITDDTRVRGALPTIRYILEKGGTPVLMSHLGRPKGQPDPAYSLKPVAAHLDELLRGPVVFSETTVGPEAEQRVASAPDGAVVVLENTRFLAGETKNDAALAEQMARLGDVFVQDAFGSVHRAHASTDGVARAVQRNGGKAVAGLLLERELDFLGRALDDPKRPLVAVVGGAKVSDKINVIESLLEKADHVLVGGAMAYTFLSGLGHATGDSLVEDDRADDAFQLHQNAGDKLHLPSDHVAATAFSATAETRVFEGELEPGWMGLDIGPKTRKEYAEVVAGAGTVLWNGPMGVFEMEPFAAGTLAIAKAMADATKGGALTVVGGGDSVAAVTQAGLEDEVSHVSTGGGAMLEWLEGKTLPGVAALTDA